MTNPDTGPATGGGAASQAGVDAAKARADLERDAASASEKLAEARRMAEERARSFVGDAADQARSYADSQKETAAQSLKDFADAVRKASDELGQRDQTVAARFVREAAGGLESLSQSVSARNLDGMLDTLRDFGRSNPTAFIAGSVLAGIAIGRFARASGERDDHQNEQEREFARPGQAVPQGRPGRGAATAAGSGPTAAGHWQGRT
ncbi:MAG TPA: hypothetical protein VHG92_10730 [Afifellaceae bacterium]|nr:hypothetical protein [Afifellaceae bacterium]